ncbi:hypothetical protein [Pseudomonas sp. UFMG81]|uniref:hypothetical protein n=1 Tax=Pseudomonas sp. UFMG81 TaxID=2745936 RepID=UPI00189071DD|nr:hypothetical protein [Pseudomonas sp. UFMG81]
MTYGSQADTPDTTAISPRFSVESTNRAEQAWVHVIPSHDAKISTTDLDQLPGTFVALPHSEMRLGDRVIFVWSGYIGGSFYYKYEFEAHVEALDTVIAKTLDAGKINALKGSTGTAQFFVERNGEVVASSHAKQFEVVEHHSVALLAPPYVEGLTDDLLDPAYHSEVTAPYDSFEDNDECLLIARIFYQPGDAEDLPPLDVAILWSTHNTIARNDNYRRFQLDPDWLNGHLGKYVEFRYQVAGVDWAWASEPSTMFKVGERAPRHLPAPVLIGAESNQIEAIQLRQGAVLRIPHEADIDNTCVFICIATQQQQVLTRMLYKPVEGEAALHFRVPVEDFAAYVGTTLNFYYEVNDGKRYERSAVYSVFTVPIPLASMPTLQCPESLDGSTLSLKALASTTTVCIERWPFMAEGQHVSLSVSLKDRNNERRRTITFLDRFVIGKTEVEQQYVSAPLNTNELAQVEPGSYMIFTGHVTFAQGTAQRAFRSATLQLVY